MAFKSIRSKLLTSFLLISIIPVVIVLILNYISVTRNIRSEVNDQIRLTRDIEKKVIEEFFNSYLNEIEYFALGQLHAKNASILVNAFRAIDFPELKPAELERLSHHYDSVASSINASGLADYKYEDWIPEEDPARVLQYNYMIDESSYTFPDFDQIYSEVHSAVQIGIEKFELRDLLVIDNESGYVIYSNDKAMDFGINLNHPRYRDAPLKKIFFLARNMDRGKSVMTDFIPSAADGMEPRLFFAAPVFYDGESLATLVFKIDSKKLDAFMTHNGEWKESGFNHSGESYIVGQDAVMRSSSRFFIEEQDEFLERIRTIAGDSVTERIEVYATTILTLPIKTEAARLALSGTTKTIVGTDYRGKKVLTSYTPLEIKGMNWAVISQIDQEEAFAPLKQYSLRMLGLLAAVILLVSFIAVIVARRFLKPINVLMDGTSEIGKDNLDFVLEPVTGDEFRTLTEMFNSMVTSIRTNREELQELYRQVSEKQREITDSIRYALRIQHAALPEGKLMQQVLKDAFVLYRPKDIVSGDFYWYHRLGNKFILTAADCTGHGVPGSFISLLGIRFLRRAVIDDGIVRPDQILARLREELINFFSKVENRDEDEIKDGIDLALCTYDTEAKTLEYAGAYNPLYQMRDGEVIIHKADRHPVSAQAGGESDSFTNNVIQVNPGDSFYIFSDGYPDQIGGPKEKKFMSKKFRELLLAIHQKEMHEQQDILQETLDNWMDHTEQTDDIIVMGFKPF